MLTPQGELNRRALARARLCRRRRTREPRGAAAPGHHGRAAPALGRGGGKYQILAIPLLVEHDLRASVDRVLLVDCEETLQLRRVQVRDGVTLAAARKILAAQASRAARLAVADDVIVNDGDLEQLRGRVETLHARYSTLARETPRQAQ